jgi:type II secretory pathway pseudopilin PulG
MNPRSKIPAGSMQTRIIASPPGAFSLIEVIGVIAIIALIAALILPPMIKHTDESARGREQSNLSAIRDALVLGATRSNSIPDDTSWQQLAGSWSAIPVSQIATNSRRYPRLYFIKSGPNPALTYTQNTNGTTLPAGLRAVIVSILGGDSLTSSNCPSPSGGSLSDADFDALWDLKDRARPTAGLWANWNGNGDDFVTERLDYGPLFHNLVLVNRDTNTPGFTINGSSPIVVANTPNNNIGCQSYYLDGTVVGLCDANGIPMTRYVLKRDIGFVFEAGLWHAQIMGLNTGNTNADNFGEKAADFLQSTWYSGAQKGANQSSALVAMYSFMYTYTLWANECPHFDQHSASSLQQVPEYMLLQSAAGDAANNGLDQITGSGGLLK